MLSNCETAHIFGLLFIQAGVISPRFTARRNWDSLIPSLSAALFAVKSITFIYTDLHRLAFKREYEPRTYGNILSYIFRLTATTAIRMLLLINHGGSFLTT